MAKKNHRHKGEGTIVKRKDGRYMGQITLFTDPRTHKQERQTVYGYTSQEVQEQMDQLKHEKLMGTLIQPNRLTLEEWLTVWMNEYKRTSLKPTTWQSYNDTIKNHILPQLGRAPLSKIRPLDIQRLLNSKGKKGKKGEKGQLASRSIHYINQVLNGAFKQAVRDRIMPYNPCEGVELPKLITKRFVPFNTQQVELFLEVIRHHRLHLPFLMALATGMRRGELLALKWEDLDMDAKKISIRRSKVLVNGKVMIQESTKTESSEREIPLPEVVYRELALLYNPQKVGFIFCNENGKPIRPDYLTKQFKRLLEDNGLPSIRFHDLRHTFATIAYSLRIPDLVISTMMGHKSTKVTRDIYTHITSPQLLTATSLIDGIINEGINRSNKPKAS